MFGGKSCESAIVCKMWGHKNWTFGSFQKAKKPNGSIRVNWPLFVERYKKNWIFGGFQTAEQPNQVIHKTEKKFTK